MQGNYDVIQVPVQLLASLTQSTVGSGTIGVCLYTYYTSLLSGYNL